jgi:D-apionate oxidoisomerase
MARDVLRAKTIALVGAGGKMGTRIRNNLLREKMSLVLIEKSADRRETMAHEGLAATGDTSGVATADYVVLAVPDRLIGAISSEITPIMKADAVMILLDPAAAYANELVRRSDCTFVVTHPCHPALFVEQQTPEAKADMFGGAGAPQDIVVALDSGREEHFADADELCRRMFGPVLKSHRVTVRDMAILEPAAAEVVVAGAATLMREAVEEAIRRGVPAEAAWAFMLGHTKIPLAIVFGKTDFPFSDAAQVAIRVGFERVIRPDWRRVFDDDVLADTVRRMLHPEER